jgi:hypothetical protein
MALGAFAAGQYTAAATTPGSSSAAVGLLEYGWMLDWTILEQVLDKTDAYGRTPIETFHQGIRAGIAAVFHEWKAVELRMLTPHAPMLPVGATRLDHGIPGTQGTDQAAGLVLTALASTPAATIGPASVTISKVKQQGDAQIQALFGPEKRTANYRGMIFPYVVSGAVGGVSFWAGT